MGRGSPRGPMAAVALLTAMLSTDGGLEALHMHEHA